MRTTIILILLVATSVAVTHAQIIPRQGTFLTAGFLVGVLGFWLGAKKALEECRDQATKRPPCTEEAETDTNGSTITGSYCKCDC